MTDWTDWTPCSKTCGSGERKRMRECNGDSSSRDKNNPCKSILHEREICNPTKCPVYTEWTEWSSCSVTCGGGNQERSRVCIQPVRASFIDVKTNQREADIRCDGDPKESR